MVRDSAALGFSCSGIQLLWDSAVQGFSCFGIQPFRDSAAQVFSCLGIQLHNEVFSNASYSSHRWRNGIHEELL